MKQKIRGRLARAYWGLRRSARADRLGFQFDLDLRDNVQRHLYRHGDYEPELSAFLLGELREGDVYADVGAHIGIHALVCARDLERRGGGRVIAFEPTPDTARRMREAAARAGLDNLTLVEKCLGSAPGRVELRGDPAFGRDDPAVRSAYGPGAVVGSFPVTTFDSWAGEARLDRLDIVKIDVEGGEHEVVLGMERALRELRPRMLVVEMQDYLFERAGVRSDELVAILRRHSYERSPAALDRNVVFRLS